MENTVNKYNLHIELEFEGSVLKIKDIVDAPFSLEDYIFKKDLEAYNITNFKLEAIKE